MNFRTPVEISNRNSRIKYSSKILSLGSCFSVHMSNRLRESKYQILQNPFGITFNPISMHSCIKSCISGNSLLEEKIFPVEDLWVHHDFHGSFSHPDRIIAINNMNKALHSAHHFIQDLDWVIITLGTDFVYSLDNIVVNNCHKRPQTLFKRRLLTVEEIKTALFSIVESLQKFSSKKVEFVFTLSPVRHLKDGLVSNLKSKSSCLLAIHDLVDTVEEASYFPAYEILMDELRDYRFFENDMLHPSSVATDYIYQKFENHYLSDEDRALRSNVEKLMRSYKHKGLHPESSSFQSFQENLLKEMSAVQSQNSFLSFQEEITKLSSSIK